MTVFSGLGKPLWDIDINRKTHIFVALFALPMEIMSHYDERFMTSQLCKTLQFFVHMSLTAHIYGVVVIAVDRYRSILHPFPNFQLTKFCLISIAFVWLVSSVTAWKGVVLYDVQVHLYRNHQSGWTLIHVCAKPRTFNTLNRGIIVYDFLAVYAIPLFILLALYVRIFHRIYDKNVNFLTEQKRMRNARVVRMLVAIVVMFSVCQLPLHVWKLYVHVGPGPFVNYLIWYDVVDVISLTNSWLNVVAYVGFNDNFKRVCRTRLSCSQSVRSQPSVSTVVKGNTIVPASVSRALEAASVQDPSAICRTPRSHTVTDNAINCTGLEDSRTGTEL